LLAEETRAFSGFAFIIVVSRRAFPLGSPILPAITTTRAKRRSGRTWASPMGPGFYAFDRLLKEWRGQGDMEGLVLGK